MAVAGGEDDSSHSIVPPIVGDTAKPDNGNNDSQNENNRPNPDNGSSPDNNNPDDIVINNPNIQGLITNNQNITNNGTISTTQPVNVTLNVVPILANNGFTGTNAGLITGVNTSNTNIMYGMMGTNGGNIINDKNINLIGHNIVGMSINNSTAKNKNIFATNNGNINLEIGSNFKNSTINGKSVVLVGMEADRNSNGSSTLINNGKIKVDSSKYIHNIGLQYFRSMGMSLTATKDNKNPHFITNNKEIITLGERSIGIFAHGENIKAINTGIISTTGVKTAGIEINDSKESPGGSTTATNKGIIIVKGDMSTGINIITSGTGTNDTNGTINITGNNGASGMQADGEFARAINKGAINVTGENAAGIRVSNYGKGINETTGTITVNDSAYGMYAESGGTIENRGKIILAGTNVGSTGMYSIGKDSLIINSGEIMMTNEVHDTLAIHAEGGKYVNKGKIFGKNGIEITSDKLGQFVIGTEANGDIGTVLSRNIKINGIVVADKKLIKSNKKKVLYKNVFVAPTIELVKENNEQAISMFYNSNLKKNNLGNVDMEIYRNKNTIGKIYRNKNFSSLISELDKFLNTEHSTLSKDEALIADKILKASEALEVQKTIKDLSGEIYSNLTRQIFDTQSQFLKEDKKLMNTLDYYDYNFNFFGDRKSLKNKGEFSGYETRTAGFVGMKKTENNTYGSIGFEHSDIKYNEGSRGTIQTIHTGIYKEIFVNEYDINLGLRADYSFHETSRKLHEFGRTAKVKQNGSYSIGFNSEVSKTFGDVGFLYIKPIVGFNLSYGKYDGFKEKNAGDFGLNVKGDDYLSILPNIGFKIGRDFQDAKLYSNIIYAYEFGDLNKKQHMSLLNNKVNYSLTSDNLEESTLIVNIGMSTSINYIDISFELGKEIGKRDNNYLALALGYRF